MVIGRSAQSNHHGQILTGIEGEVKGNLRFPGKMVKQGTEAYPEEG